jgi:hypothetical protein
MCPPISTGPQDGSTTAAPRDSVILALFVSRYYRVQIEPPTSNVLPPIVLRLSWQTGIWQTCRRSALGLGRVKTSEEDAGYEVQDWASQAAIAAMSGLIPTMFMTRVRL